MHDQTVTFSVHEDKIRISILLAEKESCIVYDALKQKLQSY